MGVGVGMVMVPSPTVGVGVTTVGKVVDVGVGVIGTVGRGVSPNASRVTCPVDVLKDSAPF